jgi:membrane protein YdbS with pleckstrin-like domain
VLALVYYALIAPWLTVQQAAALQYRLEGTTLRVDSGVYFLKRKAIPLDRVTDVVLVQGPLMRYLGLWAINIQTAGTGQQVAEAVLYGVDRPDEVRDLLVSARDAAAAKGRD